MKRKLALYRNTLNEWFELNKSERNGSLVLIAFIVLMIVYNFVSPYIFRSSTFDNSRQTEEIKNWLAIAKEDSNEPSRYHSLIPEKDVNPTRQLFKFNPNNASNEALLKLGFTQGNIESLRKYQAKGGTFKIKNDFSKMYFITEDVFQELYPYINLPEKIEYATKEYGQNQNDASPFIESEKTNYKRFDYSNLVVEINSADTTELKKIKGIGSFTAKNIIRLREHLGGFTSIDQLSAVYPLNKDKLDSMRPNLMVDIGLMQRININEVSAEQLSKHPYLSSAQAKSLVAYRTMHGNFKQVEDIKKSALIDQKTYDKVKDYLRVN